MKARGKTVIEKKQRIRDFTILSISCLFVFLTLLILYKVPYNGDDMINTTTLGMLKYGNISLWDFTSSIIRSWISAGRLYPLAFYCYALFSALPTLFAYRTFQIILNIIVISSFGMLTYKISKSVQTTSLAILLTTVFIQFRMYNDPVLAFHGMLQIVLLLLIWALYFQILAIQKGKVFPLIFSAFLYSCCILTYEISYSFIVIFIITAAIYGKDKMRFLAAIPHYIVTVLILIVAFYLRFKAADVYSGTTLSLDFGKIIMTYINQLSAGFPLSYWILSKPPYLYYSINQFMENITIWDLVLSGLLAGILFSCFWLLPKKEVSVRLFIYGFLLCVLPPTIISLSERYQVELSIGIGHLPVYVQYFGGVLLIAAFVQLILSHVKQKVPFRILTGGISLCICVVFLINNVNNRAIQEAYADNFSQPVAESAMREGLLEPLNDNSLFLTLNAGYGFMYEPQSFVCCYADGLHITAVTLQSLFDSQSAKVSETTSTLYPDDVFVFKATGDLECGLAAIGKVDSINYDKTTMSITHIYVSEMTIYICNSGSGLLYVEQIEKDGTVIPINLQVTNIFFDSDADSNPIMIPSIQDKMVDIVAERTTSVKEIGNFDRFFAQNQEKTCMMTIQIQDKSGLIQFDTVSITDPT